MTRRADVERDIYNLLNRYTPAPSGAMQRCAEQIYNILYPELVTADVEPEEPDEWTKMPPTAS